MNLMTEIYGYRMKKETDCMCDDRISCFIHLIVRLDIFMTHGRKLCIFEIKLSKIKQNSFIRK